MRQDLCVSCLVIRYPNHLRKPALSFSFSDLGSTVLTRPTTALCRTAASSTDARAKHLRPPPYICLSCLSFPVHAAARCCYCCCCSPPATGSSNLYNTNHLPPTSSRPLVGLCVPDPMTPSEFEEVSKSLPNRRSAPPPPRTRESSVDDASHHIITNHQRSASSLSKRRSVSGMRGLMPLALSVPDSRSQTPVATDEETEGSLGGKTDGYLAEALARDLELSNGVFASRNMTAGCPVVSSPSDDIRRSSSLKRASLPSSYHSASLRVHSLGPIEERNSTVRFPSQQRAKVDEGSSSDLESTSGTDVSGGMMAPSIRMTQRSVRTAATSLASTTQLASPKETSTKASLKDRQDCSWFEIDSDSEDYDMNSTSSEDNIHDEEMAGQLAPRPPTPPDDSDMTFGPQSTAVRRRQHVSSCNRASHRKSHLVGEKSPITPSKPGRRLSEQSTGSKTARRGSSARTKRASRDPHNHDSSSSPPSSPDRPHTTEHYSTRHEPRPRSAMTDEISKRPKRLHAIAIPSPITDNYSSSSSDNDEPVQSKKCARQQRDSAVFAQPSPPPSPRLPVTRTWPRVNLDVPIHIDRFPSEDVARGVPLPPEVIETIRVSIACFPETMLLSSSLTVETIRTYSKKLRHNSSDLLRNLSSDAAHVGTKTSLWQRVRCYRRGSISSEPRYRDGGYSYSPFDQLSQSSASLEGSRPWMPLRHVFGQCSDYICDALYAHIVAYNYVSTLVPRTLPSSASRSAQHQRGQNSHDKKDDKPEDIPKKAAFLLGLASAPGFAGPPPVGANQPHRLTKKLSRPLGAFKLAKDGMSANHTTTTPYLAASSHQEAAARDIQAGLLRCIVRLIATAKLMVESGSDEEGVVEGDVKNVDVLFTKSLCEIVRISEEVF